VSIHIVVRFDVKPERLASTLAAFAELADQTRREPGATVFDVFRAEEEPCTVVLVEEWADQAAIDTHMKEPHTARFLDQVRDAFATPQVVLHLDPVSA
jgi:quinol monooxygenase YgiN